MTCFLLSIGGRILLKMILGLYGTKIYTAVVIHPFFEFRSLDATVISDISATYTYRPIYIYIYICVCVCVCVHQKWLEGR